MAGVGVRIVLLGPIRAWRDDRPVALRGVSARTVLACLALRIGSVVSTGELSEALWEDDPPEGATANLQSVVSRLRRGLGAAAIETAPGGYRLAPAGVGTDLAGIEALLAGGGRDGAADELRAALRAWEGEPLADVATTTWFLPDRSRLAELRLVARDRCAELLIGAGRCDNALVELRSAVEETPLRETTQLLLAEALYRLGRNAEGLRAVDAYRRALVEESGLEASPALLEVEQRMLDPGAPASRRGGPQWRARHWLPPDTPFVGRDDVLGSCEQLVGHHRLVTVVGTGGVGKSRLAMELLRRRGSGTAVVVLLAALDADASIVTTLAAALGLESTTGSTIDDAVAQRLHDLGPTLVVLDNCEHLLPAVRDLVEGLLRRVEDVTVLATSRRRIGLPEEQVVLLEPLSVPPDDDPSTPAVQLFEDRVSRAAPGLALGEADAPLVAEICRQLAGLPLALELAAARAHLLGIDGLHAQLTRGRLQAPSGGRTMEEAVGWSLGLLGPAAQRLFAEVCVFPAAFDLEAVAAVSSEGATTDAFGELVDASLVAVQGNGTHRRFRILEPIRQVGAAGVADHAVDAYLDWVIGLGDQARACFIRWEAFAASELIADHVDDFRHALTILAGREDDERFAHLAGQLSSPLYRRPDPELVGLILEHSPDTPDGLLALVDLESGVGRPERCVDHLEQLLGLVAEDDPRVPRALVWSCPAFASMGELDRMVECAKRAVEHPATTDLERLTAVGMWALGQTYLGRPDVAERIMAEHANVLQLGPTAFIPFVRAEMCATADPEAALAWLDEGAAQARRDGDALLSRILDVARLALLVRESHDAAACRLALDTIPELLAAGLTPQAWMSLRHVATLLARLGEPATALEILDAAAASADATALVGDAIHEESALRREIDDRLRTTATPRSPGPAPRSIGELWSHVDEALQRFTETPRLRVVG